MWPDLDEMWVRLLTVKFRLESNAMVRDSVEMRSVSKVMPGETHMVAKMNMEG